MRAYIRKGFDNEWHTVNFATAFEGFRSMGWEIIPFQSAKQIEGNRPEDVVVGYIDEIHFVLNQLGFAIPVEESYPEEIRHFLGRKIWTSTVNTIANNPENWGVFIKPMNTAKKFTGVHVKGIKDLIGCGDQFEDTPIWVSESVNFVTEWRCYVRYNSILDVRPYKGDWKGQYDPAVIERCVQLYKSAPNAYAIDFGVTDKGETLLVEVNDGYSVGCYGLQPLAYAKFLSARWAEMTGMLDYCLF
jgi:ATP-grasp domain, R2K clade family 3